MIESPQQPTTKGKTMTTITKATGATANVRWSDGEVCEGVIISFGEYDEATDTDGHGRRDDTVFFYVANEEELRNMMRPYPKADFTVISYELRA
jgi:hypothetical protein